MFLWNSISLLWFQNTFKNSTKGVEVYLKSNFLGLQGKNFTVFKIWQEKMWNLFRQIGIFNAFVKFEHLKSVMDIDEALDIVGGYRRWNLLAFCMLSISMFIPLCFQGLSIAFTGKLKSWHNSNWYNILYLPEVSTTMRNNFHTLIWAILHK